MPIPERKPTENKDEFIQRCMSNTTMVTEFPNTKQRYAVCITKLSEDAL